MKQFLTALAANLVTIALCVVGAFILVAGIVATIANGAPVTLREGSILVVDMGRALADVPARTERRSPFESVLSGSDDVLPLRSALLAIEEAASDDRISGMLLRGSVDAGGYHSGYAALRAMRGAIASFRTKSKKPVHAFLVNPGTKEYYLASTASVVTLDPFGSLFVPGLSAEQVFFAGLFEKYGIGVQVSRVGRFKAAVEPFTRREMSPESRVQTESYLRDMWSEVKRGIAVSRGVDTLQLQTLVDAQGIIMPADAKAARLVDRVAYFDDVLGDLERIAGVKKPDASPVDAKDDTGASTTPRGSERTTATERPTLPQLSLDEYAPIVAARSRVIGASQAVAIVYAEGDIVDGKGGEGRIGGDGLARVLRRVRTDARVKAVVLRVNSPGGSAIASETIRRELALIGRTKPVVVSMGTVAASGGYWISTAATRVFAEPNTITGSIGVFSLMPNIQGIANRNGVTFDTVKTGRYADLFSASRPRTAAELAVLQRGVDAVYDAFIERVANARKLSPDSVRVIAEGRVWSGTAALRIGLVDSLGGLDVALRSAAKQARITGDYEVREYPRAPGTAERLAEMLDDKPDPVAKVNVAGLLAGTDPATSLARDLVREMSLLLSYNDPRGAYARMPFVLRVR